MDTRDATTEVPVLLSERYCCMRRSYLACAGRAHNHCAELATHDGCSSTELRYTDLSCSGKSAVNLDFSFSMEIFVWSFTTNYKVQRRRWGPRMRHSLTKREGYRVVKPHGGVVEIRKTKKRERKSKGIVSARIRYRISRRQPNTGRLLYPSGTSYSGLLGSDHVATSVAGTG